jgi:hypothetical protein
VVRFRFFPTQAEILVDAAADGSVEHRKPLMQLVIRVYGWGLHLRGGSRREVEPPPQCRTPPSFSGAGARTIARRPCSALAGSRPDPRRLGCARATHDERACPFDLRADSSGATRAAALATRRGLLGETRWRPCGACIDDLQCVCQVRSREAP